MGKGDLAMVPLTRLSAALDRAEAAEARVRELEQALELIASFVPDEEDLSHGDGGYEAGNVARAALNPEEDE